MTRAALIAVTLTLSVDAFLAFIPPLISTAISVGTLSFFFYVYSPTILQPVLGEAATSSPVRVEGAICGLAGYFLWHLGAAGQLQYYEHPFWYLCLSLWGISIIVFAVFLLRKSRSSESEFSVHHFWLTKLSLREWIDEWSTIKHWSESWSKRAELFALRSGWIVPLILILVIVAALVFLLEIASVLFAVLTVALSVQNLTNLFKQRRQRKKKATRLDSKGSVLQTVVLTAGWWLRAKGLEVILCITWACFPAFFWVYTSFTVFQSETGLLWMISLLGCGAYQLYFWYCVVRLLPKLLIAWRTKPKTKDVVLSFPRGGYTAFVLSCYIPLTMIGIFYASSVSLEYARAILYVWALIGVWYFALLIWSAVKPTKGTTLSGVRRDHILIPVSMFLAHSGFWVWAFLTSHINRDGFTEDLHGLAAMTFFMLLFYYVYDIRRLLVNKLGKSLLQAVLHGFCIFICAFPWFITILSSTASELWRIVGFTMISALAVGSALSIAVWVGYYRNRSVSE